VWGPQVNTSGKRGKKKQLKKKKKSKKRGAEHTSKVSTTLLAKKFKMSQKSKRSTAKEAT